MSELISSQPKYCFQNSFHDFRYLCV